VRGGRATAAFLDISNQEILPSLAPVFLCCLLPMLWQSQRVRMICRRCIGPRRYLRAGRNSHLPLVLSSGTEITASDFEMLWDQHVVE